MFIYKLMKSDNPRALGEQNTHRQTHTHIAHKSKCKQYEAGCV